jgi:hypothetical protein
VDTGPPRREDETEQIESSHKDAKSLLEPDPRGARKRGKGQDIRGYHNTGKGDLMVLTIEIEGPKKEAKKKGKFFLVGQRKGNLWQIMTNQK